MIFKGTFQLKQFYGTKTLFLGGVTGLDRAHPLLLSALQSLTLCLARMPIMEIDLLSHCPSGSITRHGGYLPQE